MENITLEIIKTIATVGGVIIGIWTLRKGYSEYRANSIQKRVEFFKKYSDKQKGNETLKNISTLLEEKDIKIRGIPRIDRYFFLGYYEEIALLVNSGVLKPEIAHYMFSYYAKLCWESNDFWHDINRDSIYWRVFKEFVEEMRELERKNLTIPLNEKIKFKI